MSVLAIDGASRAAAWVARVERAGALEGGRGLTGGHLDRELPAALRELAGEPLEAVVALTGPGSYTGVRAGMAAALGLAAARGKPLHGLDNLAALAAAVEGGAGEVVTAVADAGRGGLYVAAFELGPTGPRRLGLIERVEAASVRARGGRPLSTTPIDGLETALIDPLVALCAAVPVALGHPALEPAGLTAAHAEG